METSSDTLEMQIKRFSELLCPITQQFMKNPVVASDGFSYDNSSILPWIKEHKSLIISPITREVITTELLPSQFVKLILNECRTALKQKQKQRKAIPRRTVTKAVDFKMALSEDIEDILNLFNFTLNKCLSLDILKALDPVANQATNLNLTFPQIVVIGGKTHGKSTFLGRLIGFPIFPHDTTTATSDTRCPINVRLRRRTADKQPILPTVSISRTYYGKREGHPVGLGVAVPVAMEKMSEYIGNLLSDETARNDTDFCNFEITVTIHAPLLPNIDILDMPGLFDEPLKSAAASLALTEHVINKHKDRCIFLLVTDCNTDSASSIAARLVRQHGIELKTIGVFTKLDILNNEEAFQSYLNQQSSGELQLPGGWMGCANISPLTGTDPVKPVERLVLMEKNERQKLQTDFASLYSEGDTVGMAAIRQRVMKEIEKYIVSDWKPQLAPRLVKLFNYLTDSNTDLGVMIDAQSNIHSESMALISKNMPKLQSDFCLRPSYQDEQAGADFRKWSSRHFHVETVQEFQRSLIQCATWTICGDSRWLQFHKWSLWDDVNKLKAYIEKHDSLWSKNTDFDSLRPKEQQDSHRPVIYFLKLIIGKLASANEGTTETKLVDRLVEAVIKTSGGGGGAHSEERKNHIFGKTEFSHHTKPKRRVNSSLTDVKVGRFPALLSAYKLFLDAKTVDLVQTFEAQAESFISQLPLLVERTFTHGIDTRGNARVSVKMAWLPQVHTLVDRVINMWMETVILGLAHVTEEWELSVELLIEDCVDERTMILKHMADTTIALSALQDLSNRIAP